MLYATIWLASPCCDDCCVDIVTLTLLGGCGAPTRDRGFAPATPIGDVHRPALSLVSGKGARLRGRNALL